MLKVSKLRSQKLGTLSYRKTLHLKCLKCLVISHSIHHVTHFIIYADIHCRGEASMNWKHDRANGRLAECWLRHVWADQSEKTGKLAKHDYFKMSCFVVRLLQQSTTMVCLENLFHITYNPISCVFIAPGVLIGAVKSSRHCISRHQTVFLVSEAVLGRDLGGC